MTTIYGIKNCDTIRKARRWLEEHGVEYRFHDHRTDGLDPLRLRAWAETLGWEKLLNRNGTTFRKLPPQRRENLDEETAIELMLDQPALIRRPLLERGETLQLGFKPTEYAALFGVEA